LTNLPAARPVLSSRRLDVPPEFARQSDELRP
jgi:hypothetical protein